MKLRLVLKGGPGSGHRGHVGRPGKVGGSTSGGEGRLAKAYEVPGKRPSTIPVEWEVHNAPRPLLGHRTWEGRGPFGIHYAAINPNTDMASEYAEANRRNGATALEWVDEDIAFSRQAGWYKRQYPDTAAEIIDDPNMKQYIIDSYFDRVNSQE